MHLNDPKHKLLFVCLLFIAIFGSLDFILSKTGVNEGRGLLGSVFTSKTESTRGAMATYTKSSDNRTTLSNLVSRYQTAKDVSEKQKVQNELRQFAENHKGETDPSISNIKSDSGSGIASETIPLCIGDVNGDGTTNVNDLLLVVQQWGNSGIADVAPMPSGNGVINIDDLLLVVSFWGCFPPAGSAQCSDTIDNDGDGLVDQADLGCHSLPPFGQYNVIDNAEFAQCSDNSDNDGDGLVDNQDSGCYSGPWNTYDPGGNEPNAPTTACSDGIDSDGDGKADWPLDFSCSNETDNDEINPKAQCQDGIDNDGDGEIDFGTGSNDVGCLSNQDNKELNNASIVQCNDGADNDNDTLVDYPIETGCTSATDTKETLAQSLYITEDIGAAWDINASEALGALPAMSIPGHVLDPNINDGKIDLKLVAENLFNHISPTYNGYVLLDVESPYLEWLHHPTSDPLFSQAQEEMVGLLNLVKSMLPLAKVGYYAIPFQVYEIVHPLNNQVIYSHVTAPPAAIEWAIQQAIAPSDLLNAVDFTSSSVYDGYMSTNQTEIDENLAYLRDVIVASSRAARGKPVLPVVWHRYGVIPDLHKAIHPPELKSQQIQVVVNNNTDGIFWWGADRYYYNYAFIMPHPPGSQDAIKAAYLQGIFNAEIPKGMNSTMYFDQLHAHRLRLMSDTIFGVSQPYCGDGIVQSTIGEQCDDSNATNGDGCNVICEVN